MKEHRHIISNKLRYYQQRIDELKTEIKNCKISIDDLRMPLRATSYDKEPGKGENQSPVETAIIEIEKYERRIIRAEKEKDKCKNDFEKFISPLDYIHGSIIRYYYIDRLKAVQIGIKTNYSTDSIKRLIAEAQDILYNTYKNTAQL